MDDPNPPDAAERAAFHKAYDDGAFADALGAYQRGLILRAIALLKSEQFSASWNDPLPESPYEWAGTMATALDGLIESMGDKASYKLGIARDIIAAVGVLQGVFEGKFGRAGQGDRRGWDTKDLLAVRPSRSA